MFREYSGNFALIDGSGHCRGAQTAVFSVLVGEQRTLQPQDSNVVIRHAWREKSSVHRGPAQLDLEVGQ
jgi:hypothetical protein